MPTYGGNGSNNTLTGDQGGIADDSLAGFGGNDTLYGGGGNDTLDGGLGADSLVGGVGDDVYIVDNAQDVVVEGAGEGVDTVRASLASYTLTANVENLTYTGGGSFSGGGNALDNVITGGAGADTLNGGVGADTMIGGAGDDLYFVDNALDVVVEDAGAGVDSVKATVSYNLGLQAANVEKLVLTTTATSGPGLSGTGNALANTIVGTALGDTLDGGAGADTMQGGAGDDLYVVDDAGDVVQEAANAGTDTVRTTLASYTLATNLENLTHTGATAFTGVGNAAANVITVGDGNDTLTGGGGNDSLVGGAGSDTAVYSGARTEYVVTDTGGGVFTVAHTGGTHADGVDTVSGVETLQFSDGVLALGAGQAFTGDDGANTLSGTAFNDTISGLGGPDSLSGLAGDDQIDGGAGADTLDGGTGADTLTGGDGGDTYVVDSTGDVVVETGATGVDTVLTTLNAYTLGAGVEALTFAGSGGFSGVGNALANTITGGAGADTLTGGAGDDLLQGGGGQDTAVFSGARSAYQITGDGSGGFFVTDTVGSDGTDHLVNVEFAQFGDNTTVDLSTLVVGVTVNGDGGNNALSGGAGPDTLNGFGGNDTLDGGAGADSLVGGTGDDVYVVDNAGDTVVENAGEGTDTVQTSLSSYTLGANVENLTFTGAGPATGVGNALNNVIVGTAAADSLSGGDGADTLTGGAGGDTLDGGSGTDTAVYAGPQSDYTITTDGSGGYFVQDNNPANGDEGRDHLIGVEKALFGGVLVDLSTVTPGMVVSGTSASETLGGGAGGDTIRGFDGNDTLYGGAGADSLDGGAGSDVLYGGADGDTLVGGTGADQMFGGDGDDLYVVDATGDVVTEAPNAGNDTVQASVASYALTANVETLIYTGVANASFRGTGNDLANSIVGGDAADSLDGGAGADTLVGGKGDDLYFVDNAGDVIVEQPGGGSDSVKASVSYTLGANVEKLVLTVAGLTGAGNADANLLSGTAGADTLDGGAGADTLQGGAGDDTYVVDVAGDQIQEAAGGGTDTVKIAAGSALTGYTLGAQLENLVYGGAAAFTGTGNTLNNAVSGGTGNDSLYGGAGDDTLTGGAGDDSLDGGSNSATQPGNDVAAFSGASTDYTVTTSGGVTTVVDNRASHPDGTDTLRNIESVRFSDGTFSLVSNNAPIANADSFVLAEDGSASGNVLTNDRDFDSGTTLKVASVTVNGTTTAVASSGATSFATAHGTATITAAGAITYTPAHDYNGADSFTYTETDQSGASNATASATVSLTVTPVNDAPTANPDTATIGEDATTPVTGNVLGNDTDPDIATNGDTLHVVDVGARHTSLGDLTLNANGAYSYTVNNAAVQSLGANQSVTDVFTYTAADASGATSQSTLTVTITGANDAPTAGTIAPVTVSEDHASFTQDLLAGTSDPEGDTLSVSNLTVTATDQSGQAVTPPAGADSLNGSTLTVNPGAFNSLAAGESRTLNFAYTISDGNGGSTTGHYQTTITGVNDAVAFTAAGNPAAQEVTEDVGVMDGKLAPAAGSLAFADPDTSDAHTASVSYGAATGSDAHAGGVAGGLAAGTDYAVTTTVDESGHTVGYQWSVSDAAVQALGDGESVTLTAHVAVSDGPTSDSRDVTLVVHGANDAPVARDDAATTTFGQPVTIAVLANDTDVDGDRLTVTGASGAQHGSVVVNSDNTVTYTPATGTSGSDAFSYTISDGHGGTSTAQVSVTVQGPVALHHSATTTYYTTIQAAVDHAATSGDTITVAAGHYQEQVTVDAKSVTITGSGEGTTFIDSPDAANLVANGHDATSSRPDKFALVAAINGADLTLSGFTVDGHAQGAISDANGYDFVGVYGYDAAIDLEDSRVTGVRENATGEPSGNQRNSAIIVHNADGAARDVVVSGSTIDGFQKNAFVLYGGGLDAHVTHDTITGAGDISSTAQNGVQISYGATGEVDHNTISGLDYAPGTTVATSVLLYQAGDGVSVHDNTITGAGDGGGAGIYAVDTDHLSAHGNTLTDLAYGLAQEGTFTTPVDHLTAGADDNSFSGDAVAIGFYPSNATAYAFTGSAAGDDLEGSDGADTLAGVGGDDSLYGGAGADSLSGGAGANAIDGGVGVDTVSYAAGATLSFTGGHWVVTGGAGPTAFTDTLTGVEKVVIGGVTHLLVDHAGGGFQTIGDAVAQAATDGGGEVVELAGGTTYAEQVAVSGFDLTIKGVGAGAIIKAPDGALAITGHSDHFQVDDRAIVTASDGATLNLSNLTVDGDYAGDRTPGSNGDELSGVAYLHASGSVSGVTVSHTGNSVGGGLFGLQHGSGVLVDNGTDAAGGEFTLEGSTVDTFQKTGVLVWNADVSITGDTIHGIGATGLTAQNDLQIGGSSGSIDHDLLDGFGYTGPDYGSAGVIAYRPTDTLTIDHDSIAGATGGLLSEGVDLSEDTAGAGVEVTNNSFDHLDFGVDAYAYVAGGLQTNPDISGNSFSHIGQQGVHFDAEEVYGGAPGHTFFDYQQAGSDVADSLAGSQGDDSFSGLAGDDTLVGRGGADTLDGGDGRDTAVYENARADYVVTLNADGTSFATVRGTEGGDTTAHTDTLISVEVLKFQDATLDLNQAVRLFHGGQLVATYGDIQSALDASADGDTVQVAAGTYGGDLTITHGVTLEGANAGKNGTDATRGQETILTGHVQITATSAATIDGFEFLDDHAYTLSSSDTFVALGVSGGAAGAGHVVENSVFDRDPATDPSGFSANHFVGSGAQPTHRAVEISNVAVGTGITVAHNLFTGGNPYGYAGDDWRSDVYSNGGNGRTTISDNTFENSRSAINADNFGHSVEITGNAFTNPATAVSIGVGSAVTDLSSIHDNTFGRVDTDFNFTNLTTPVTFNAAATGETLSATAPAGEVVFIDGGSAADSLTGAATSNYVAGEGGNDLLAGGPAADTLDGGAGVDTATFASGTLAYDATGHHWTVTNGAVVDTLIGIEKAVIGGQTYELVDQGGANVGGFQSVQAAVDAAAASGDIVKVAAGTYDFSTGGLNLSKSLTIQGAQAGVDGAAHTGAETEFDGPASGQLFNLGSGVTVAFDGIKATGNSLVLAASGQTVSFTDSVFDLDTTGGNAFYTGASDVTFSFSHNALTQSGGDHDTFELFGGVHVTVDHNSFTGMGAAGTYLPLILNLNADGTVTDNTFSHVDIGVLVASTEGPGIAITGNSFDDIHRDPSFGGLGAGVVLYGPPYGAPVTIDDNAFSNADAGVRTTTAAGGTIPATGLSIDGDSFTNVAAPGYASLPGVLHLTHATGSSAPAPSLYYGGPDDNVITPDSGVNAVYGGDGVDTATYASGVLGFDGTEWTLTDADGTDTLSGVEKVEIGGVTYDLVDHGGGGFQTIGAAVAAAHSGDHILLAGGTTYQEQVTLDGLDDVTLTGAASGAVIQAPATLAVNGTSSHFGATMAVVAVENAAGVTVSNLTVDGAYAGDSTSGSNGDQLVGVAYLQATGAVDGVHVEHVGNSTGGGLFGLQHGAGVLFDNGLNGGGSVTLENATVDTFQKSGVYVYGADAHLEGDTITGIGSTTLTAQNAVQFSGGATGDVTANTISDVQYSPAPQAGGVLIYNAGPSVAVSDNSITHADNAIYFYNSDAAHMHGDTIGDSYYGVTEAGAFTTPLDHTDSSGVDDNTFTGAPTVPGIYFGPTGAGGFAFTGTAAQDYLDGSAGADTFTGSAGNDALVGEGGTDTAVYGAGATLAIAADGHWTVAKADGSVDDLYAVEKVVIGSRTYELVDQQGQYGGFQSVQAAIDAAQGGETILVAPGTYTETKDALGTSFGLVVDKAVTLQGVEAAGAPITSASAVLPTIVSGVQSNFGTNFYVTGDDVTIKGLAFQAVADPGDPGEVNKAIEVTGNNFVLTDSKVGAATGIDVGASVYVDDQTVPANSPNYVSHISAYTISDNILYGDVVATNGAGHGHPASGLVVSGNDFVLNPGSDEGYNWGIILNGEEEGLGYRNAPITNPTITGNTFAADYTAGTTTGDESAGQRLHTLDQNAANLPDRAYVDAFLADNGFGPQVGGEGLTFAFATNANGTIHAVDVPAANGVAEHFAFDVWVTASDASASAATGDVLQVYSGADASVQTIVTNGLQVVARDGSEALHLQLGSGVTSLQLKDDTAASHVGVNVQGNDLGDSLIGASGDDTLVGGAGADRLLGGGGNDSLTGGGGSDLFNFQGPAGYDAIADFAHGVDKIGLQLSGFGIDDDVIVRFQSGSGSHTAANAPTFFYHTDTGVLEYDVNGHATAFAHLDGHPTLTAADLFLY